MLPANIGPFTIERELGRGGMGVVYLARDTRLDRQVAIKSLPAHLAQDPDRLARFQREAKVLASLSHPNIGAIYGLEEANGHQYLILEYVEGETLADRLAKGPIPVDEALTLAKQIAEALEIAHEKGIVHRDLKPGNVMVTPDGHAKVLDFGLARTEEGAPASSIAAQGGPASPTVTSPARFAHSPTVAGVIMGTAGYMSPEQARGKPVDKRSDIFSFGCVLYEMLTGVMPFRGETVADAIGATLHKESDLGLLPAQTPRRVQDLLANCLAKDRKNRLHDIGDARLELERAINAREWVSSVSDRARTKHLTWTGLVLALALAVVAGSSAWMLKPRPAPEPGPVVNTQIMLPKGKHLAHFFRPGVALSPDGRAIAYFTGTPDPDIYGGRIDIGNTLMLRRLDEPEAVVIAQVDEGASQPVFSPDGRWVAYATKQGIRKVSVDGTRTVKLNSRLVFGGMSWGDGGQIVACLITYTSTSQKMELIRFPADGGEGELITTLDASTQEELHTLPHFLPGGRSLLFSVIRFGGYSISTSPKWSVWALDLDTGKRSRVIDDASNPRYVRGTLVFMREGALYGAPFDLKSLTMSGPARILLDDVKHFIYGQNSLMNTGAGLYDVAPTGDLVYARGGVHKESKVAPLIVDLDGKRTPLGMEPAQFLALCGSPDGRSILTSTFYPKTSAISVYDLERGVTRPQARTGTDRAIWGPGPDTITYLRTDADGRPRIVHKPVGGSRADETEIPVPDNTSMYISAWSRDGKVLLALDTKGGKIVTYTQAGGWERVDGMGEGEVSYPTFSPDARWLAFVSTETGQREVLVKQLGRPGASEQVSVGGGWAPIWSDDGRHIYFRQGSPKDQDNRWVMAVDVSEADGRLTFAPPRKLFRDEFGNTVPLRQWDMLGPDRFLMVLRETPEQIQASIEDFHPDRLVFIQNWASRLSDGR